MIIGEMKKILILCLLAIAGFYSVDLSAKKADFEALGVEIPSYTEWEKVTLTGKLKMKGLPLSPSIRVYMEKDQLIELSIRVTFMGEVGRIIMTPEEVLGINKIKKTYTKENIDKFLKYYPGNFSDVQEMLLGRVVFPGFGVINDIVADYIDVSVIDEVNFAAVPNETASIPGFDYGYLINSAFSPSVLLVVPTNREDINFTVSYSYEKSGYDLIFSFTEGNKGMSATLDFNNPQWSGDPLKAIGYEKYRELSMIDFLKNLY